MGQIKIYALNTALEGRRDTISQSIHRTVTRVLGLPEEKRFHRYFPMAPEDFLFPENKSNRYTIVEVQMMAGRTKETKKALVTGLFTALEEDCGLSPEDLEIVLLEAPAENWGFRGQSAEDLQLGYRVKR
jgi:4-oxalocrotonate tautomerase family enzyme